MRYKRKRVCRMRGTKTHGWGSMKKHRGSGNRGGFGMAGSGKRADHIKPFIIKEYGKDYFGRRGFKTAIKKYKVISIKYLSNNMQRLIEEGKAKKEGDGYKINLAEMACDKLLSNGEPPTFKLFIQAKYASKKAKEKIECAGGRLVVGDKTKYKGEREDEPTSKSS